MKTFVKTLINRYWKWILLGAVILLVLIRIFSTFFQKQPPAVEPSSPVVDVVSIGDLVNSTIDISCQVEPVSEVPIVSEVSGPITKINVIDGDSVVKDQVLFEVENIQQRVAVADARVALDSARLSLKDLQDQNDTTSSNSLVSQTQSQQNVFVDNAFNALMNNDLQAYPEDNPDRTKGQAPEIIGNYSCIEEGQYVIDVYPSSARSGASFKYSGLESGTSTVSTTGFSTILGECGLELLFPEGFDKNETWVIPVPNTRSASYPSAVAAYESAQDGRDIILNQTEISPEALNQAQGRVNQAQLRYQLALDNFDKTIVKAKIDGVVSGFTRNVGEYVNPSESLGDIKTTDALELIGYINAQEQRYVDRDSKVSIKGEETYVRSIAQTIDSLTRKLRLVIEAPENVSLSEGLSLPCSIRRGGLETQRDDGGFVVPLSAISIIGVDSFVFVVDADGVTTAMPVTVGVLLGDQVIIYGIESGDIVADARGIRDQQKVIINL